MTIRRGLRRLIIWALSDPDPRYGWDYNPWHWETQVMPPQQTILHNFQPTDQVRPIRPSDWMRTHED